MDFLDLEPPTLGYDRLVGMSRAVATCRRISSPDSAIQTVLLYGIDEAGKAALALELAHAWLCRTPTENGPCGTCDACGRTQRGSQPDLLSIRPVQPSNLIRVAVVDGDEQTGQIGIKQFIQMKPIGSRFKVICIEQCDRMNAATANALLKTLEEPPPYVRIVMTAPAPSSVLNTIASRCLCIACALPSGAEFPHELDEVERVFSQGAPERVKLIQANRAVFEEIWTIANHLPIAREIDVLALSARLRQVADQWAKGDRTARQSLSECLEALATACRLTAPHAIPRIVEAHRRIIGNGSPAIVITAMFGLILTN